MTTWLFWALASAFFAGLTAILAKAGVAEINPNLATAIRTTVVLVAAWGLVFFTVPLNNLQHIPGKSWVFLIFSGLATGLSWICYFHALQLGRVSQVAPIDKLSVLFAILFSILFLGERPTAQEGLGAALIICGTLVMAWK